MLYQDLIRFYGRKTTKPNCLFKLDIEKAYDSIEWAFIEEVLEAFDFPTDFIRLVMECINRAEYNLMINGACSDYIEARRGLRKGDPMSPLLFMDGIEYISILLKKVVGKRDLDIMIDAKT